jgi:hypothetical protein
MTKDTLWWARTTVGWHPAETADQVILLPESDARTALAWWEAQFCTTWSEVAAVAPDLNQNCVKLQPSWTGPATTSTSANCPALTTATCPRRRGA